MQVAMNGGGDYCYPSLTPPESRLSLVRQLRKQCSSDEWFCPHCFAVSRGVSKHPVSLVNPKAKIIHFRHKSGDRSKDCKNYSGESDKHLCAKMALLEKWSTDKNTVQIETRKYGAEGFRIPDVMVSTLSGEVYAHEVQVSRIDVAQLASRTESLKKVGCKQVHWYLYGGNVKDENVNYLIETVGAYAYRLQYDAAGLPEWRALTQHIIAKNREGQPGSHRNYSSNTAPLTEGDRAIIIYGKLKGQRGIVRHIGNLFGDGIQISLDLGEGPWRELPEKQVRRIDG